MEIESIIKTTKPMQLHTKTVINLMYRARIIEESVNRILKGYELSIQQYNVLRILRGQGGNPANLSTVTERMVDRNSNTTRLIDKLLKKDLVKRQVCATNRRKVELFITTEGLELLKVLDPIVEANNQQMLNQLDSGELEQLNTYLNNIHS
ncbi:MarR family winged helix-turn-helix transcriptional regulator [Gilvibacter sediminis]|uniref:MarR family winged helix-turn-helix transcriptional regulator n=1 Tax=Gilvibacter sediminis TaxID=379071 RepID=UPI002350B670|nr:MarR family transcriptional regulator [Gilvibacter sediminis]